MRSPSVRCSRARGRRRILALLMPAALVTLLAAPTAAQAVAWYDAGAGAPASVTFNAVAVYGGGAAVVAVGHDSNGNQAVIYRRSNGSWQRETIPGLPAQSSLIDVAVTDGTAWAVGYKNSSQPLVVNFGGGGPALAGGGGTWAIASSGTASRFLSVGAAGSNAFAGDTAGNIYPLAGAGAGDAIRTNRSNGVNGIAAYGSGQGLAALDGGAADPRIFSFSAGNQLAFPATMAFDSSGLNLASVAALDPSNAVAIDANGYWEPGGDGLWHRNRPSQFSLGGTDLRRTAIAGSGSGPVEAVAGGIVGVGSVWRRTGSGGWTRDDAVAPSSLNGIAVSRADDMWAVGARGTLLHFYTPPAGSGSSSSTATPQSSTTTYKLPPRKGQPVVYVIEPGYDRPTPGRPHRPKRMMRDVSISRSGHRLRIRFRLLTRASVIASAKRGGKVVGEVAGRSLSTGLHTLTLRFRGNGKPTELRIFVGPAQAASRRRAR